MHVETPPELLALTNIIFKYKQNIIIICIANGCDGRKVEQVRLLVGSSFYTFRSGPIENAAGNHEPIRIHFMYRRNPTAHALNFINEKNDWFEVVVLRGVPGGGAPGLRTRPVARR